MARKAPCQVALILTLMVGFFAGYLFNTLPGRSPDESADEKEASSERSDSAIRGYADALVHIRQSAVYEKCWMIPIENCFHRYKSVSNWFG